MSRTGIKKNGEQRIEPRRVERLIERQRIDDGELSNEESNEEPSNKNLDNGDLEELATILVCPVAIVHRHRARRRLHRHWKNSQKKKTIENGMEGDESGIFNIEVDSSSESTDEVPRDFQSEESFQAVKREWRARIETGEIHKTLKFPLNAPSKPDMQQVLYAIEELYFLRRFEEAIEVAAKVLESEKLGDEFRSVVEGYKTRCVGRLEDIPPK